jgi:hypothetical protein
MLRAISSAWLKPRCARRDALSGTGTRQSSRIAAEPARGEQLAQRSGQIELTAELERGYQAIEWCSVIGDRHGLVEGG